MLIVGTSTEDGIGMAVTSSGVLFHVHNMACGIGVLGFVLRRSGRLIVDVCDMDEDVGAKYDTSGSGGGIFA
jgi:hypothetical protein